AGKHSASSANFRHLDIFSLSCLFSMRCYTVGYRSVPGTDVFYSVLHQHLPPGRGPGERTIRIPGRPM
ncbi:MAG: hypothetical protein, partial [Olavius algarvensis Delta 4 endosymbiont]